MNLLPFSKFDICFQIILVLVKVSQLLFIFSGYLTIAEHDNYFFGSRNKGPIGSECSLWSASKPLSQWKEPRSVIPLKLGIERMNKVPGEIKIFERPLNIPKRPSIENIGILYNYGPRVRGTNAQRLLVQSENTRTFVRTSLW